MVRRYVRGRKRKGELYLKYTLQREGIGKYQRVDMGSHMEVGDFIVLLQLFLPPSCLNGSGELPPYLKCVSE